jgi:hypothetical protein
MKRWFLSLFWLIASLTISTLAQQSEPSEDSSADWAAASPTLAGQGARHGMLDERAVANYVIAGITVTQMFTDNADLSSATPISNLSYDFEPQITLNYFTPKVSYDFGVLAGFVDNQKLKNQNQATQTASFDLSYHLTHFVVLRASDNFRNSTGLWNGVDSAGSTASGIGSVQAANSSLYPYSEFRANTALAELSIQLSPDAFAGIRGEQAYTWFPSGATDPVLGDLVGGDTYSAEMFYNHHFTQRNWGGVTLRAQRFDLDESAGRTNTATLLLMYARNFRPTISLTIFAGPQFSTTAGMPGVQPVGFRPRLYSPAAGAVFNAETHTTSGVVSFLHQVSDGGGLLSAVTLTSASADLMRRLAHRFEVGPAFTYAQSAPIIPGPTIQTYSGMLQSAVRARDCTFRAGYARDERSTVSGNNLSASANRVWISFSYDFLRPIGR